MLLRQRGRDFFYLLKIYFVTFSSNYTRIYTLVYVGFMPTKEVFYVLNPWGLVYFRFELRYAKATRRHLCQLDVVLVVILD